MKKIVFTLLAALIFSVAGAQTIFEELADNYADVDGFSAVQLTSDMFELYLKKKNIDPDDPVYETLENLEDIIVITQASTSDEEDFGEGLKIEIIEHYKDNGYSLFKTEKNPGSDLKIYIRKDGETIESMGLISSNSFSVNLVEMNGDIDLSNIASISSALNIRGLEQLRVFGNDSPSNFFFNYQYRIPEFDMSKFEFDEQEQKVLQEKLLEHQKRMEKSHHERMKESERMRERSRELYDKYQRFPIMISGSDSKNAEYFIDGKKVDLEEIKSIEPDEVESIKVVKKDKEDHSRIEIKLKENN